MTILVTSRIIFAASSDDGMSTLEAREKQLVELYKKPHGSSDNPDDFKSIRRIPIPEGHYDKENPHKLIYSDSDLANLGLNNETPLAKLDQEKDC